MLCVWRGLFSVDISGHFIFVTGVEAFLCLLTKKEMPRVMYSLFYLWHCIEINICYTMYRIEFCAYLALTEDIQEMTLVHKICFAFFTPWLFFMHTGQRSRSNFIQSQNEIDFIVTSFILVRTIKIHVNIYRGTNRNQLIMESL